MTSSIAIQKCGHWGYKIETKQAAGENYTVVTVPRGEMTGLKKLRTLDFLKFLGYYITRG